MSTKITKRIFEKEFVFSIEHVITGNANLTLTYKYSRGSINL